MYFTYRKIVICTRPLFVPAVLVSILNLLSKIGLSECSKFNSIVGPNNDFTVFLGPMFGYVVINVQTSAGECEIFLYCKCKQKFRILLPMSVPTRTSEFGPIFHTKF